jgi:hypothetical protein
MISWSKNIDQLGHEQIYKEVDGVIWYVPNDPNNSDYQAYLRWLNGEEESGTIS